jgi:hypothetical protein
MKATSVHPILYAVFVWTFAGPAAYAAGVVVPGDETAAGAGTIQRQNAGAIAGSSEREAANRIGPIKGRETTAAGSDAVSTALRATHPAALQREEDGTAIHSRGSLPVGRLYASKQAVGGITRANLIRRPAAAVGAVHRNDPMGVLAGTRRPSSGVVRGANLPIASLNAAARNGVVGGARPPGRGMIGGPANTGSVVKGGIDGTMLRRRS